MIKIAKNKKEIIVANKKDDALIFRKISMKDVDLEQMTKRIYLIMSKHIGSKNAISKRRLFTAMFGKPEKYNIYKQHYLWTKLLVSLNSVRKNTNCFIISEEYETDWYFFVAKTNADANIHITQGNNRIAGIKMMQNKVKKAVKEQWWKQVAKDGKSIKREITVKSAK